MLEDTRTLVVETENAVESRILLNRSNQIEDKTTELTVLYGPKAAK